MTKITLTLPNVGELDTLAEPKVATALKALEEFINTGKIESTDNIKAEGITEASLSSAIKSKLGGSFVGLAYEAKAVNFEGEAGKLYGLGAEITATLPAATSGRTIGLFANAKSKVSAKAGKVIYGDGTEAGTVELLLHQHLLLEADGTNWLILAGESKREAAYSATTKVAEKVLAYENTPSATRETDVQLMLVNANAFTAAGGISIGGVTVQLPTFAANQERSFFFKVPANALWKWESANKFDVWVSQRLL